LENVPSSKNYDGGFAAELMLKDLGIANAAAKNSGSSIPLGNMSK
jgi:3-hydroxyisobutyrate dehydrogenase-like beta-hydroxyacid dehydrogenase